MEARIGQEPQPTTIQINEQQTIAPEIARGFEDRDLRHAQLLEMQNQPLLDAEQRDELARADAAVWELVGDEHGLGAARGFGGSAAVPTQVLRDVALRRGAIIAEALERRSALWVHTAPALPIIILPPPVDHSFWWARTRSFLAPRMKSIFLSDGLHFSGGPKVDEYDGEIHASFGAVADFALGADRMPHSKSGRYLSAPYLDLLGGALAYAPNWDLIQGNGIASCTLTVRQRLFQWKFGQSGPGQGIVAEASQAQGWRIYLRNTGHSHHLSMPGRVLPPPLTIHENSFNRHETLWAEVEVRFDIYLNTTGALLWLDPEMILKSYQWPLASA